MGGVLYSWWFEVMIGMFVLWKVSIVKGVRCIF